MSIQFPTPASQGDTFTASNGVIYTYDNGGWTANSVSGLNNTYVNITGDTMTGDLTVPNLISEGDVQTTSLNGGPLGGFRNQIINGDFRVWQRGNGSSNTNVTNYGMADRWRIPNTRNSDVARVASGGLVFTKASSNTTDQFIIDQRIETTNIQGLAGKELTFSFESNLTGFTALIYALDSEFTNLTPVFSVVGGKQVATFTLPNLTFTGNAIGVQIQLASYGSQSVEINNVQLEPGPVATPFEHRPISVELSMCKRYYQTSYRMQLFASNNGTTNKALSIPRPVVMRVNPSEAATVNIGTLSLTGSSSMYRIESSDVGQSNEAFINDYTADAEL